MHLPIKSKKTLAVAIVFNSLLLLVGIWWLNPSGTGIQQRIATQAIDRQIASALPIGSSREDVAKYLASNDIPWGPDPDGGHYLVGFPNCSRYHGLLYRSVTVVFSFSPDWRLSSYQLGDKYIPKDIRNRSNHRKL